MAIPNEIQTGRLNAILHKLLDMKEGAPAPTLAPDIFSMMALEVDRPEWKFLGGERECISFYSLAAGGAGTYGSMCVVNPADSGIIAVTGWVWNVTGATRTLNIRVGNATLVGYSYSGAYRGLVDTRFGILGTDKPTTRLYYLATASPHGATISRCKLADAQKEKLEFVLGPDTALCVDDTVANEGLALSFTWRERAMNPSETR